MRKFVLNRRWHLGGGRGRRGGWAFGRGGLLHQLDEAERTIVFGLYVAGLTCKELGGEMLAIPEGTVKSRAYYARRKLADWLKGGGDKGGGADRGTV